MKYYVSYYEKYPIYEPAEGGYYYSGAELVETREFRDRRKALRHLRKLRKENDFVLNNKFPDPCFKSEEEKWCSKNGTQFGADGQYVGEGWFVCLERKLGSCEHGYELYC